MITYKCKDCKRVILKEDKKLLNGNAVIEVGKCKKYCQKENGSI